MKNAFCLITIQPNDIWLDFLQKFTSTYDVYIMIDDNSYNCTENISKYPNINFIQIEKNKCKTAGYIYSSTSAIQDKDIIAWDKALYYFTIENRNYDNIWFCEDDVYIHSINVIEKLDHDYFTADLICKENIINNTGTLYDWYHMYNAVGYFELPWYNSMICVCRISLKLLDNMYKYVSHFGKLNFIELMIPTIANQNGMVIVTPPELHTVQYRTEWNKDDIDKSKIYHPFKNMNDHLYMRNLK